MSLYLDAIITSWWKVLERNDWSVFVRIGFEKINELGHDVDVTDKKSGRSKCGDDDGFFVRRNVRVGGTFSSNVISCILWRKQVSPGVNG